MTQIVVLEDEVLHATKRWAKWKRPRPEENNKHIINNAPFTPGILPLSAG
jgi:hypothetical protein